MARVAVRSSSLPRDASAGLELIMNALVPPCLLDLVRARRANFPSELALGARSPAAHRSQRMDGRYNDFLMRIRGRPIRYTKSLSTGIILIGQLTDAGVAPGPRGSRGGTRCVSTEFREAIAAGRSAGIRSGQRCAVRPAALDGILPPSSPGAFFWFGVHAGRPTLGKTP